jgi:methionyl-tRNA formyltransferase
MSKVSIAFLGSHPLGEKCLQLLTQHEDISVEIVITYPPSDNNWWEGNLYETASKLNHNVVPLSEENRILDYEIDYLLSVYYPNVLGSELLDHPRELPLNLHQAELPRYRGSNVFTHSILNARDDNYWKHGTTFHIMAEEVDAGDIIDRRFAEIDKTDTAWSLYQKVRKKSVELFRDNLAKLSDKDLEEMRTPQSEFDGPKYFYRKSSINGMKEIPIDKVQRGDVEVYDRIRALDFPPHEPAYTRIQGEKVYLTLNGYNEL